MCCLFVWVLGHGLGLALLAAVEAVQARAVLVCSPSAVCWLRVAICLYLFIKNVHTLMLFIA